MAAADGSSESPICQSWSAGELLTATPSLEFDVETQFQHAPTYDRSHSMIRRSQHRRAPLNRAGVQNIKQFHQGFDGPVAANSKGLSRAEIQQIDVV